MVHNMALLKDIQNSLCTGCHQRVAAIGGSMVPGNHGRGRLAAGKKCAHREPVSKGLCHGHHIRLHAVMLPCEHVPGTPHAALDFIQDKKQVMLITEPAHAFDEFFICRVDAALPLDCLHNHSAGFVMNQCLHAFQVIEIRKADSGHQGLKRLLIMGIACHGQGAQAAAVEGVVHGYDFTGQVHFHILTALKAISHPCVQPVIMITLCNL